MANRRFEMYQYRHILFRMRSGDSDRDLARDGLVGRRKAGELRIVEEGLAAGDRVIVSGVQKVFFPGMPVDAEAVAMGAQAPAPTQAVAKN